MKLTLLFNHSKSFFRLIAFLLLCSNQSFAQNYQAIQSAQINYYGTDNLDYILATRTDSIELSGTDSTFYSYKTMRNDTLPNGSGMVGFHAGASWFGKSTIIEGNGKNTFINRYNEPISFETQAILGDTFEIYTYPNGGEIIFGTISLQDTMTVLGALDSIKQITLFSNEPSFILNGEDFILSQNHGFVRLFPFYSFPQSYEKPHYAISISGDPITMPLTLVGSDFPRVGITKLTGAEMYAMDVNDQVSFYQSHYCSPIFMGANYYANRTVLNRTDLGNNSVGFGFDYYYSSSASSGCWSAYHPNSLTVDNFSEYGNPFLPEELHLNFPGDSANVQFTTMNYSEHCGQQLLGTHIGFGYDWQSDDTFQEAIEPASTNEFSLEGFGQVYTSGSSFNGSQMQYANISGSIYHYAIGSEECGDLTIGIDESQDIELTLKPNPVTNGTFSIICNLPIQECQVTITNLMGQIVLHKKMNSYDEVISVENQAKGTYIVKYLIGNRSVIRKIEIL